jgi:hypothetical protein
MSIMGCVGDGTGTPRNWGAQNFSTVISAELHLTSGLLYWFHAIKRFSCFIKRNGSGDNRNAVLLVYWCCVPSVVGRCDFRCAANGGRERNRRCLLKLEGVGLLGQNVKENGLYIGTHFSFRMGPQVYWDGPVPCTVKSEWFSDLRTLKVLELICRLRICAIRKGNN